MGERTATPAGPWLPSPGVRGEEGRGLHLTLWHPGAPCGPELTGHASFSACFSSSAFLKLFHVGFLIHLILVHGEKLLAEGSQVQGGDLSKVTQHCWQEEFELDCGSVPLGCKEHDFVVLQK